MSEGRTVGLTRQLDDEHCRRRVLVILDRITASQIERDWVASVLALDPDLLAAGRVDSR